MTTKLQKRRSWKPTVALVVSLCLAANLTGSAEAEEIPRLELPDLLHMLSQEPTVPQEWAGIWTTVDSLFTCTGTLQETDAGPDTLCTGDPAGPGEEAGPVTQITCTGTVTPTSANIMCNGEFDVLPDCRAVLTSETQAFRNGDTYSATVTTRVTYVGTGAGCSAIPSLCQVVKTHGTRVSGEPANCGATAVEQVMWGLVKKLYR